MARYKSLRRFLSLFIAFFMLSAPSVSAEQTLRQLYDQGIYFVTPLSLLDACNTDGSANSSYSAVGKSVFYIGNSITVGMIGGGLLDKSVARGLKAVTVEPTDAVEDDNSFINSSVEAAVSRRVSGAIESLKLRENSEDIKKSDFGSDNAEVIVVALGTNQEGGFKDRVVELITYLRTANSTAKIYWVKTNFIGSSPGNSSQGVNDDIDAAITETGDNSIFKLDPSTEPSLAPDSGDIHFSGPGYAELADFVVEELIKPQTISTSSTDPDNMATAEERSRYAWNYFANEKHLSPNAVAGIMGNLNTESGGIDPHNVQLTANQNGIPDGPEIPIEAVDDNGKAFRGGYGYGIAQWTTEDRQNNFYGFSLGGAPAPFDKPRSTGNLRYQLDYIWYELESEWFDDVLAVLKDPNVTLNDASDKFAMDYEAPRKINGRGPPKSPPADPETTAERDARLAQNAIDKQDELEDRRAESENMMRLYNGSTYSGPSSSGDSCASSPSTGEANKYIPDCGVNDGNAAIACTAINQLLGIPYDSEIQNNAGPTQRDPELLHCSSFVGMAIYRAFGTELSICSISYLSNENFEVIDDLRTIQPGDLVGKGTVCGRANDEGVFGHIAIVVSYDAENKKLITVETGSSQYLSGIRTSDLPNSYDPHLFVDQQIQGKGYTWAVRYIGDKTLQPGAN